MRQPIVYGKYLLLERISVGGMAEVFKAKSFGEEGFEKVLAIKRILPSMAEDEEFIQMFIDEAKISGQLSHPNIGQIYELGEIEGSHFIAMEYVWGKDVLQIQNRFRRMRQKMPLTMAVYIASRVCEGLDYAHRKKDGSGNPLHIIHRDVSPQNVLVSYAGEVKIIDFGIAKARSRSSKTQAGVLKGKFGYMSPEQVRALPLDQRSDVFAIGTILYEMCTGDRLFTGESDFATLEKVRNALVPPPSKADPRIPPALEAILLRALRRESDERYPWASEMQEELQAFLMTQNPIFTAKTLANTVGKMFEAERRREEAAMEEYKKIRRENLDEYVKSVSAKRELAVSLLPQGPPPENEEGGATQIGGSPFDDDVVSGDDLLEIDDGPDHVEEGRTQIYSDSPAPGSPGAMPAEPTFIFNAESGQLVQAPEQSTVIFAQGDNGGSKSESDLPQGPTVIFDVNLSQAVASTATIPSPDQISGTMPVAFETRSSVVKDILIGVLVALVLILGIVLWKVFSSTTKGSSRATLVVSATPPRTAEVFVDGTSRGAIAPGVPLQIKELAPQEHHVVVQAAGLPPVEQTVQLMPGDVKVLTVTLPVSQAAARLRLVINPLGARVFLDGAEVSEKALQAPLELSVGQLHEVRVVKDGYKDANLTVKLEAGQTEERTVQLEETGALRGGQIVITSEPRGATVIVNGVTRGVTPAMLRSLPAGRYEVTVALTGFLSQSSSLDLSTGKTLEKAFKLEKKGATEKKAVEKKAAVEKKSVEKKVEIEKKAATKKGPIEKKAATEKKGATEKAAIEKKAATKKGPIEKTAAIEKKAEGKAHRKGETKPEKKGKKEALAVEGEGDVGYLVANTIPWAKVFVDGKDTGKTTPVAPRSKIPLKPGKHKVTFEIEGKQFDFTINVTAGQITRLIKKLPVE